MCKKVAEQDRHFLSQFYKCNIENGHDRLMAIVRKEYSESI